MKCKVSDLSLNSKIKLLKELIKMEDNSPDIADRNESAKLLLTSFNLPTDESYIRAFKIGFVASLVAEMTLEIV